MRKVPAQSLASCGIRRRGFTLIELLVVIAIIALLVAILMPSLQQARELARLAACKSNLHAVGLQVAMYASEYGEYPLPNSQPGFVTNDYIVPMGADWMYHSGVTPFWIAMLTNSRTWYQNDTYRCPASPSGASGWGYGPNLSSWQCRAATWEPTYWMANVGGTTCGVADPSIASWYVFCHPSTYKCWFLSAMANGTNRMLQKCFDAPGVDELNLHPEYGSLANPGPTFKGKQIRRAQACCPVLTVMNSAADSWDCFEPHGKKRYTGTYLQGVDPGMPECKNYLFTDSSVEGISQE